jgi:replicative DNA helicase
MTNAIRKVNSLPSPDLRIADDVQPLPYDDRRDEGRALSPERLAPHNADMEEATLGAVMISNGEVMQDIGFLKPEHFFLLKNGLIFEAMQRLWARGDAIDNLTVAMELERFGQLDDVGGNQFLTRLLINTPSYANAKTYAHIVERGHARRGLIAAASELVRLAQDETLDIDQVMARAVETVGNATFRPSKKRTTKYDVLYGEIYRKAEEIYKGGAFMADMPTHLRPLDDLLSGGGIERGRLYTFAGRPGMGKTIVLTYLARALAKMRADSKTGKKVPGKNVLVFSFEMQSEETARRMAASASLVAADKIKRGEMEDDEWSDFTANWADASNYELWISQSGGMDLLEVEAEIRQHKMQFGLDIVFIDYVQLVKVISKRGGNREQEIS